jgi:hypothetical protein
MNQTFFVLLGEAEDASAFDPAELHRDLGIRLAEINRTHESSLVAPFVLGSGIPEFTAVLRSARPIYRLTREISEAVRPHPVRLSLARGPILGGLETRDAEAMDGPAFDLAGELLYRARKEDRLLYIHTGEPNFDTLFNALLLLLHRHVEQWSDRQWEVVDAYRRVGRQSDVAEELEVSQQAVSAALASAGWRTVMDVEKALDRVLEKLPETPLPQKLPV